MSLYGSLPLLICLCMEGSLAENMEHPSNSKTEQLFSDPQVQLLKTPLEKWAFEKRITKKAGWHWETAVTLLFTCENTSFNFQEN